MNLKSIGCSNSDYDTVRLEEARTVPEFNWYPRLAYYLGIRGRPFALTKLRCLRLVRAIGWVIGGFAAS